MQTRVDPFLAAVIHGALENIAIEMGHKLMRMSYSSIIRESEDFGAALTDATGRQLCECTMSTPLQSGPIPGYIEGILKELEGRGDTIRPGDVFMHNDAYAGAFRTLCAAAHKVRNREDAIMRRCPGFIFVFLGFWISARALLRIILIANLGGFPTV